MNISKNGFHIVRQNSGILSPFVEEVAHQKDQIRFKLIGLFNSPSNKAIICKSREMKIRKQSDSKRLTVIDAAGAFYSDFPNDE